MWLHPGMSPVCFLTYYHRPCVFSCILLSPYTIKQRFSSTLQLLRDFPRSVLLHTSEGFALW